MARYTKKRTRSNFAERIHCLPDKRKRFRCPLNKDFILPARMECQDRRKNGFVPTSPSGFTACRMNENAFAALSESSFILLARVEYRDARKNGLVPTLPSKFT
ncbi:MAG: hypothetical protein SPI20_05820, partial [Ruminococcus callidus]|nr:hypothetical protein [Ruminococcus callidus]